MVEPCTDPVVKLAKTRLSDADPKIFDLILKEQTRQQETIGLIASENLIPEAVTEALSSCCSNKYSEGYPGARYYAGNEIIDQIEILCQQRALRAFHLDPSQWGVNVQPLSGSPANFEVFNAVLEPHQRILHMDLPAGGHLSHGFCIPSKKITATSRYFDTVPFKVDRHTGLIDYEEISFLAERLRPAIIVAGVSSYPRLLDYAKFRAICDKSNSLLMADMAHIAGLVAAGQIPSPFDYADIVTTTTHKTLRGPRAAMIFYRKYDTPKVATRDGSHIKYDLEARINSSVFPGTQGGPHNHTITALAVALELANQPEFAEYSSRVIENAQAMCRALIRHGFDVVTGGTDIHLLIVDLTSKGVFGEPAAQVLDAVGIIANKNAIPRDTSTLNPSGIRFGTPTMTTRGCRVADFDKIAEFINRGVELTRRVFPGCKFSRDTFDARMETDEQFLADLNQLKQEVRDFARSFPIIGNSVFDVKEGS